MEARLEAIRRILDTVVGSRTPRHQGKGRFWNLPRNDFVSAVIYGQNVIVLGKPDDSALIKALKGVAPFDGSRFPRMPTGGPYVNDVDISFIAQWIRDGAPDNDPMIFRPTDEQLDSKYPRETDLAYLTAQLNSSIHGAAMLDCLRHSLQAAVKLEFATIPPYLTAMWSIQDSGSDVVRSIREVVVEEMLHMGLACNMLVALSGKPALNQEKEIPSYPGHLPGNVNPPLLITLRRLTPSQLKVFMDIEYPEFGPISAFSSSSFDTIGAFYTALLKAFEKEKPKLDPTNQREEPISGVFKVTTIADVRKAIGLIKLQGEGSNSTPEENPDDLAHYYRFREIYIGTKFVQDPTSKKWGHTGAPIDMPKTWPMADIPKGGYLKPDVPDEVWKLIHAFDVLYTSMLDLLQKAWVDPKSDISDAVNLMPALTAKAKEIMQKPRSDGKGNYGPCFRIAR